MRRCLSLASLLLLAVVVGRPSPAQDKALPPDDKGTLAVGKNITATFHPYNVTARLEIKEESEEEKEEAKKSKLKQVPYTTKGKFHCLITEYDLLPVVMLFVRGTLDDNPAFRDLLTKIDGSIARNPGLRLRSFVVFISDDIEKSFVEEDQKREEAAKKIQKLADDLKLKFVVLTLASKSDVAKYALDPGTALTAVLYQNLRIEAVDKVSLDKLDKADADSVKAVMKDVTDKLKATR